MHHLKFKFTGFLKVFTQYALILRRSVFVLLKFISDISQTIIPFLFSSLQIVTLIFFR
jgi:hypothetical protein